MLELVRVDGFYGSAQVLWDLSLRVDAGEIVVLIGSNGCGKSSVLKAIAGLLPRVGGKILHKGYPLGSVPTHNLVARGIGLVLERRRLFPMMTVEENLMAGAHSVPSRETVRETLRWVENLLPIVVVKRRELAVRLSGGEQQMVAIARSLMSRPELLLMDEPFLGLSPRMTEVIGSLMLELRREGVTILFNEQNVQTCASIASRAYLLKAGRVVLEVSGPGMANEPTLRDAYLGWPAHPAGDLLQVVA